MDNGKLITYQISGNSMNPLLQDAQEVQIKKMDQYFVGDVVVAKHPIQSDITIIKRIELIASDGCFRLRGINSKESTDRFGLVSKNKIIGKVISGLKKPEC